MSNPIYRFVRSIRRRKKAQRFLVINTGLCEELSSIQVSRSGLQRVGNQERLFMEVDGEGIFYGQQPNESERYFYRALKPQLPGQLSEEAFCIAMDFILRYRYPHCMPNLTMPYPKELRWQHFLHPKHHETIAGLPDRPAVEVKRLQEIFRPKPGEHLLGLGAYIGMGARRWMAETILREYGFETATGKCSGLYAWR
jgi:hypothetical protein